MTIKVLEKTKGCFPELFIEGEWIDLVTAEEITLRGPYSKTLKKKQKNGEIVERYRDVMFSATLIPLGICMQVPEGCEAILAPRSSTFKKWGLIQTNGIGVIDFLYSGDRDEWKMPVMATRTVTIPKGTRIAQFRIQLSQKATFWQRMKWYFSWGIKLKRVASLDNPSRGGFGSTDKKHN